MANIIASLVTLSILAVVTFYLYKRRVGERPDVENVRNVTMDTLLKVVKDEFADALRDDDVMLTDDISYEVIARNKSRIEKANTESTYGIPAARQVIVAMIRDIVERELPTMDDICAVMDFRDLLTLDAMTKFEILLVKLSPEYGRNIMHYLEKTYRLTDKRVIDNGYSKKPIREFDYKLLDVIFLNEVEMKVPAGEDVISYSEALDVMAIKLYQEYHGNGPIDSLLLLNIDGVNIGTSGSIRYEIDGDFDIPYRTTNSVWIQIDAKWVLLSFIDFYSVARVKKTINQLMSWGSAPPMTEKAPTKVGEGYDGSRRVAVRPPAGETWACFIRKFVLSVWSTKELLDKPNIKNHELPATLIYFLMKAEQTVPFSGEINTGKTSAMKGAVEFVDCKNINVLEQSFELALREVYKNKRIFTVKPTDYVSNQNLQDLMKKMDGWMSIAGEIADDIVAARVIQFCLIASAFTIFSGHWMDDYALITGLSNSLVSSGEYHDHDIARSIVLDVIHHNIHFGFTRNDNTRHIQYISQIIKESELEAYPEIQDLMNQAKRALDDGNTDKLAEIMLAHMMLTREYYTRKTDRVRFSSRKIIEFNEDTMSYETRQWYTPDMFAKMLHKLDAQDRADFIKFYKNNWRQDNESIKLCNTPV